MENKKDIRIERLEKLKQATIINFTENINYNNKLELYDTLIENVFNGNFNDIFLSNYVDSSDKEVFDLASKYKSLCFYEGDSSYWLDSVEGVYLSDLDLVTAKILDNYDFLLKLSKEGKEESLKELLKFQKTDIFSGRTIIDYLRNVFINDDVLVNTIKSMSGKNDDYKDFTLEQKALLCLNPEGVLYKTNEDNSVELIPSDKLLSEVKISLLGEDNPNFHLGDALKHMSIEDFDDIINNIYTTYQEGNNINKK